MLERSTFYNLSKSFVEWPALECEKNMIDIWIILVASLEKKAKSKWDLTTCSGIVQVLSTEVHFLQISHWTKIIFSNTLFNEKQFYLN